MVNEYGRLKKNKDSVNYPKTSVDDVRTGGRQHNRRGSGERDVMTKICTRADKRMVLSRKKRASGEN